MRVLVLILGLVFSAYAENFAVVVGIDNYQSKLGVTFLKGAKNDAEIFRNLLIDAGFKSKNIILLLDKDATKRGIRNALIETERKISTSKKDRFFYFHAGHGAMLNEIKSKNLLKTALLIPYDFSPKDENSYIITQRDLLPLFKKIDEKVAFGMLSFDSCFSANAYRGLGNVQEKNRYSSRYYNDKIKVGDKFKLSNISSSYPYKRLHFISASRADKESQEDDIAKRGVFSMAFEYCLKENRVTREDSLKTCLNNKYHKNLYVYEPKNRNSSTDILQLDYTPKHDSRFKIKSNSSYKELASLVNFVNSAEHDFRLKQVPGGYLLIKSPTGTTINTFSTLKAVKKFLSNYRLIGLKGRFGSDIDIKVTYTGSQKNDYDIVPTNKLLDIKIVSKSIKKGALALFSLNKEGRLFMIEPNKVYGDFRGATTIQGETTAVNGVDFLKVMVFDRGNALKDIKVDEASGEVADGEIEKILSICRANGFYGAIRKTIVSKGVR